MTGAQRDGGVAETGGGEHADESATGENCGVPPLDFDPEAIQSRTDILDETGYTPREFVVRLLELEGGRLPQQALTEYTDLSEASVSRYLQQLEDEDVVVRLELGREKVLFLPETAPSRPPVGGSSDDERWTE